MKLVGRPPALDDQGRDLCRVMRERRQNGESYMSTTDLAEYFNVCEATIRNSARNLHAKHSEFVKRLVRLSAGLREKTAKNSR